MKSIVLISFCYMAFWTIKKFLTRLEKLQLHQSCAYNLYIFNKHNDIIKKKNIKISKSDLNTVFNKIIKTKKAYIFLNSIIFKL